MLPYQKLLICLIFALSGCDNVDSTVQPHDVTYHGALKNIMHRGDLSAKVSLSEIEQRDNLYALGAIEDLKGEIQIFDGRAMNSFVKNNKISLDSSYTASATLLVKSYVSEWTAHNIPESVKTKKQLQKHIRKTAKTVGINTDKPFPFLLIGAPDHIEWHIIDWPEDDTEHSHEKHIRSGLYGELKNQSMEILGFYSDDHHGVFTHHTTDMHMHMRTADGSIAGHVDEIIPNNGMTLKLPKTESYEENNSSD